MSSSSNPVVSIVVLNYNGLKHLDECLDSLMGLRFPSADVEVVLADNASTDGSLEFVEESFPSVRRVAFDVNHGFAKGNNLAARQAQGKWLVFLNNDTRVDPGFLEPLLEPLGQDGVVASASRILNFEGDRLLYCGGRANLFGFGYQIGIGEELVPGRGDQGGETLFACGCATAIDRDFFLKWDGFDEDFFAYYEDVDLGWRTWVLGGRVVYVPESVVYHKGDASFQHVPSARKQRMWNRNVLYLVFKNYEDENLKRILSPALLLTIERAVYFLHQDSTVGRDSIRHMFRALDDELIDAEMRDVGVAHLLAVRDFVVHLNDFRRKRERIQKARRVSDRELFEKFEPTLEFEDLVNELSDQGWQDRLLPFFSLEGLIEDGAVASHLMDRLGQLERSVMSYRGAMGSLEEELQRKTRDQAEKATMIESMNTHIQELLVDRAELRRIQSKKWFKLIDKTKTLLGK